MRPRARNGTEHSSLDLDRELDALYQLPLSDFVSARNALAKRLQKSGETEPAHAVKILAKPSVSAWALNQLYWTERGLFDELVAAAENVREAHARSLRNGGSPDDGKHVDQGLADAIRACRDASRALLERSGLSTSVTVLRRLEGSLEAIASLGARHSVDGRLTKDVPPPGFGVLNGIAGAPLSNDGEKAPAPAAESTTDSTATVAARTAEETERELARSTLAERERELELALDELEMAEALVRKTAQRLEEARRRVSTEQEALVSAEARLETARARVVVHESRAAAARQLLAEASK
jgi:hypothetical protein